MTYIINGEKYTEFDINKRCAELLGEYNEPAYGCVEFNLGDAGAYYDITGVIYDTFQNYCESWDACSSIIEKCWDGLMERESEFIGHEEFHRGTVWELIMQKNNCNALTAACIFYIESNSDD